MRRNFSRRPRYYDLTTPEGISLEKIALTHGCDCLASTVYQDCVYRNTGQQCRFCGIGLSLQNGATIREKAPADLACAAALAQQNDGIRHVTLTTGAWPDETAGMAHLAQCVAAIKQASGLPIHVQVCPPEHMDAIDRLRHAGADTIGIHIETAGALLLEQVAPAKAARGLATYIKCWEHAVSVFGKNQVSSFLIAGLGEPQEKIISTADLLCSLGVFPFLLPLRPIPGTPLAGARPPQPGVMLSLYAEVVKILKKYGMSSKSSKAGCVRCGACSALALFEDEGQ